MSADRVLDDSQRMHLLADVAGAVAWSPDPRATLRRVAELLVPRLADCCILDVLEGEAVYRRLAIVHADPRWHPRLTSLLGPWTPDPRRRGVAHVVSTGESQMEAEGAEAAELLPCVDADGERLIRELGPTGYVSVPLVAHSRPLGALTLVAAGPGRRFGEAHMALAQTLARVAGLVIANARLDRELADTSRRQDDLLAALSHQLRTPLTAMMAWLRLIRLGADDAETARAFETIERNGRILGRIVDDLMDTARVLMGKASITWGPVDLVAVIERAVASQAAAGHDKGVRIETRLDPAAAGYIGDRERLEQIVAMLVANAVKFTPPGGRVVAYLEGDGSVARICVSDTGIGIAADLLPHVFDLFRRGIGGPGGEGLGLGLAMVRGLVELHGGLVEAASDGPDRGATFTVTLPRVVSGSAPPPSV